MLNEIIFPWLYIMTCFDSYLHTTDPHTSYSGLWTAHTFVNIVFHVVAYMLVYVVLCQLLGIKKQSLFVIASALLVIMIVGYLGRLYRSKEIYQTFLDKQYSESDALMETRNYMRTAYFSYYFLG